MIASRPDAQSPTRRASIAASGARSHAACFAVVLFGVSAPAPVLAVAVNWLPDADGFRDVTANWSSAPLLPGAADDVRIDVGGANPRTITHRNGIHSINSLLSAKRLVLQLGTLAQGSAKLGALLHLSNAGSGPADSVEADFSVAAGPFALSGFDAMLDLTVREHRSPGVHFAPLEVGLFEQLVQINLLGHNASGYRGALAPLVLTLRANVSAVLAPACGRLRAATVLGLLTGRKRPPRVVA